MHHFEDDHRSHRGWRRFEAMGSRGFAGWGGPRGASWGDWGGFGDSFRIGRMLASGDLRLIALYLIEQQPRHGYDLIKAIEERTGGIYVPSPGVIYPALTFLEEANYVTSVAEANKRLYTITEEGKAHLSDNRAAVEATLAHLTRIGEQFAKMKTHWEDAEKHLHHAFRQHERDRDIEDVAPEVNEARRELKQAIKDAIDRDPAKMQRLADILRRAAAAIRGDDGPRDAADIDL